MSMYRQYEDPYKLEKQLAELKEQRVNTTNDSELQWLNEAIYELEERVNFAWQDDEYDEDYARENYPEEYARGEWR